MNEELLISRILSLLPSVVEKRDLTLTKLHGDASNRIYYRLETPQNHWIVMQRPPQTLDSPSEEISKSTAKIEEYSFLNMQRYLAQTKIRVPRVFASSDLQDLILLEDLGDLTLEKQFKKNPASQIAVYRKAINALLTWQNLKQPEKDDCLAWHKRFDLELFEWEFEHFLEWGLEKGLPVKLPKNDAQEMRTMFRSICQELIELPTCLCHRDYQSRNLMLWEDEIVILDFQDALMGPRQYDLVALLRDSYIELTQEDLTTLQQYYLNQSHHPDSKSFLHGFDLQTVQRKLKDAGRFHYIHLFKNNPNFLPHVPTSYRHVNHALHNLDYGKHLLPILAKYIPEFTS